MPIQPTAIDRNVWQFLVTLTNLGCAPRAIPDPAHREEHIATVRLSLHGTKFCITPTVQAQLEAVGEHDVRRANEAMREVFLHEIPASALDAAWIARTAELSQHHRGPRNVADCQIVAEAEAANAARLLTFDKDLLEHLSEHATIPLMTPSAYWEERAIPHGTPPTCTPHPSNPLLNECWWRW